MKSVPPTSTPEPKPPARATTTRFLRLKPASDVPAVVPEAPPEPPRPSEPERRRSPGSPATSILPPGATGSQRLRLRLVRQDVAPERDSATSPPPTPLAEPPGPAQPPESADGPVSIPKVHPAEPFQLELPSVVDREVPVAAPVAERAMAEPIADSKVDEKRPESVSSVAPDPATSPPPTPPPEAAADSTASLAAIRKTISPRSGSGPARQRRPRGVFNPRGEKTVERPPAPRRRRLSRLLFIVLAALLLVVVFFLAFRHWILSALNVTATPNAIPHVTIAIARLADPNIELPLPGTIESFQQASIYARTGGYVKRWLADIGDQVKEHQLLAELDTPEVDQLLIQARAALEQAQLALTLAQTQAQRWTALAQSHAVSQQDADEKTAKSNEAQGAFSQAHAAVDRLVQLESGKEIMAPFAGKITYRNIEVGRLVSPGSAASHGDELFRIAQMDPVRITVEVPESHATAVHAGLPATVEVTFCPGRIFTGEVIRDAGTLDGTLGALRTELRVANPEGLLLPGGRAQVHLQLFDPAPVVLVPSNTLINTATGTLVAELLENKGREIVHYLPVKVGREFGSEVEVLNSVRQGDQLVVNPTAELDEGMAVSAQPPDAGPLRLLPPKPSAPRA